jgi:beta-phosphoglucomutase-like phosphatase (HAD superfamily)
MKFKTALYDLDGTTVKTRKQHRIILLDRVLREAHGSFVLEYVDPFWFETNRDSIIANRFKVDPKKFWEIYKKHDTVDLRRKFTELYDKEDPSLINQLKLAGIQTGLVTSAPSHIAEYEISLIGKECFNSIIIARSENGISAKPAPDGLIECMKRLGAEPENTIYFGNAEEDYLSCRAAGIQMAYVYRGDYNFTNFRPLTTIKSLSSAKKLF